MTHPDDLSKDTEMFEQYKSGKFTGYSLEKRYIFPNGSVKWVNMMIRSLDISEGSKENKYHLCIIKDITDRKKAEETLKESERSKSVLLENLPGMAYRCKNDRQWTMEFVSKGCFDLTGYYAENLINNRDLSYNDLIADDYKEIIWDEWKRVLELHEPFRYEYEIVTSSKKHKWVLETGQGIFRKDGSIEALEGIIIDITESKMRQYQIEYANDHDFMTGLFNRRYYETQKERLDKSGNTPVSILVADINGVRMINDTFGHIQGDILIMETAKLLQKCCRESDILARIGGDEFAIILPYTSREKAFEILKNIRKTFDNFNSLTSETKNRISLSMGYGTKDDLNASLQNAEKEADEYLRRRKIFEQKSLHNSVLSSIMATMYARSQETEEHSQRISENCIKVAERLGLAQSAQDELHLFAMLHDIGKVGIDDRILNKPGKLNDEEWTIMKTHPEIGFRIVMSVPELSGVANYILTHHERWDGKGYPLGISGEDIPILSRILAVADAYDAMIESRVYRKALSKEEALNEIKNNSGTQFDPNISNIFIEILRI
ncbi:MAG TPA: diguanylate cyclase [Petrotogaceae bacterium]|nr:diguanylate cyclase [Petrotogaceae bacterium]HQC40065.1 diguanylate cyclase [Petrotogaceae bacterium]